MPPIPARSALWLLLLPALAGCATTRAAWPGAETSRAVPRPTPLPPVLVPVIAPRLRPVGPARRPIMAAARVVARPTRRPAVLAQRIRVRQQPAAAHRAGPRHIARDYTPLVLATLLAVLGLLLLTATAVGLAGSYIPVVGLLVLLLAGVVYFHWRYE